MSDPFFICAVCQMPTKRCVGHVGLRAPYQTPQDRRLLVDCARYLEADRNADAQYAVWRRKEMEAAARRPGRQGA